MNEIKYCREDLIAVLRTLEEIVVSLDRIGAGASEQSEPEYHATIVRFLVEHCILEKAAQARTILSAPFSKELGQDEMADLEREMQGVNCWTSLKG